MRPRSITIYPKQIELAQNKHIVNAVNGILAVHDVELEKVNL
jgi:hypothetical protein